MVLAVKFLKVNPVGGRALYMVLDVARLPPTRGAELPVQTMPLPAKSVSVQLLIVGEEFFKDRPLDPTLEMLTLLMVARAELSQLKAVAAYEMLQ